MQLKGPVMNTPYTYSRIPMRVLLGIAVLSGTALGFLMMIDAMFLYLWAYFALAGLSIAVLLAMITLAVIHRIRGDKTRKRVSILLWFIVGAAAMLTVSVCMSFSEIMMKPFGMYTSPEGDNRAVVFVSVIDMEGTYQFTAAPMISQYFYRPALEAGGAILTADRAVRAEWIGNDRFRVYRPALDEGDEEQNIYIDFTDETAQAEADGESAQTPGEDVPDAAE